MKTKNTFLSFLRHAASLAGGILIANPDPRFQALGAVLGALGAGWGMKDEHAAENPGAPKSPVGGSVGMILLTFACFIGASTFTGCAGAPGTSRLDPVRVETNATRLAKAASLVVLNSDPDEAAELKKIADRIEVVITRGTLSHEQIALFLDALDVKPKNRLLVAALVTELTGIFTDLTGQTLPDISHPLASATLRGVRAGITEALALQAAVQPVAK
jgi:hypothetical protein